MDLIGSLGLGFETALSPENVFYCFVGVLLGTLVGVLPGIGPTATIAMLLPITFSFEPVTALIMLAGIYYGAQYGGSTTAILINLPGETSSAVTAVDGHAMAKQGRAGPALATAAIGSFFAGTVGTLVLALFAPLLASIALEFGSAEFFSLVVLGLIASTALARGSTLKAIAMIVLGLLFGTVGQDLFSGTPRYTFGVRELYSGINFVSVAVGMFGVAEILRNLEDERGRNIIVDKVTGLLPTREDLRRAARPILRGTGLGAALGQGGNRRWRRRKLGPGRLAPRSATPALRELAPGPAGRCFRHAVPHGGLLRTVRRRRQHDELTRSPGNVRRSAANPPE